MAMMPSGDIVPLTEVEADELRQTGSVRGQAAQLVSVGDVVHVNGRACRVRKITNKDIVLRPIPADPSY